MRIAAVLAIGVCASSAHSAVLLYQQVFNPPAPDSSPEIGPWTKNAIGGFNGTYLGNFGVGGLVDANGGAPIGRVDALDTQGTALYTGIGGPVTGDLRAFYTVDGQAGFALIDPAAYPNLNFNIWANQQAGGADDFGRFIFEGQTGGSRGPKQWYVSTSPMAMVTDSGLLFNHRSLQYDPAAGNWNLLTLDSANTVAPVVGGPAGALPADVKITGVGVLHSVTNPANDFSSWNYADYRLTDGAIPEPTALLLLTLATPALVAVRRRK